MATRNFISNKLRHNTETRSRRHDRPKVALLGGCGLSFLRAYLAAELIEQGYDVGLFFVPEDDPAKAFTDSDSELSSYHPAVVLITVDAARITPTPRRRVTPTPRPLQKLGAEVLGITLLPLLREEITRRLESTVRSRSLSSMVAAGVMGDLKAQVKGVCISMLCTSSGVMVTGVAAPLWRRVTIRRQRQVKERFPRGYGLLGRVFGLRYSCLLIAIDHVQEVASDAFEVDLQRRCSEICSGLESKGERAPDSFVFVDFPQESELAAESIRTPVRAVIE